MWRQAMYQKCYLFNKRKKPSKNTKLCFSAITCEADINDTDEKMNEVNIHLENYFK